MCDGVMDMCNTSKSVCFVQVDYREIERKENEYACIEYDDDNDQRQACLDGLLVFDYVSLLCCNERDQCNADLNPPLPHRFQTHTIIGEDPTTTTPMIAINGMYH